MKYMGNIPPTIDNKYKTIRPLGSGAAGEVFLVDTDGKKVAIKLLKPNLSIQNPELVLESFKNEFTILKNLNHPNITNILDFGFDAKINRYYFTSEFIEAENILNYTEKLNPIEIEKLFVEILRALEYLHSKGIYHFDIKTSNILVQIVDKKPKSKLIDFGLAAFAFKGKIIGTPSYIAPEIILKNAPDNRADLYSLGVALYFCLTKQSPFRGKNVQDSLNKHLSFIPPNPSTLNSKIPKYLDQIVMKLLEKNPANRYQSASYVIRDLNIMSPNKYEIETPETLLSYIPFEGKLIGREKELKIANEICDFTLIARTDTSRIINITGQHGVGKKRLLKELKYHCQLAEMQTMPIIEALESNINQWEEFVEQIIDHPDTPAAAIIYNLTNILDKPFAQKLISLLKNALNLTDRLLSLKGESCCKVVFVFSSKRGITEAAQGLIPKTLKLTDIQLNNFSKTELNDYIILLTGFKDPPQRLVDEIFSRTDGNPFYVTEVIKTLISNKILFDPRGRWKSASFEDLGVDFSKLHIPNTLKDALILQYEDLTKPEKNIVQFLSILNKPALKQDLKNLISIVDFDILLSSLIKKNVVRRLQPEGLYLLKNDLLRKFIYKTLDENRRSLIHDKIADYFQSTSHPNFSELAYHIGLGTNKIRGFRYLCELSEHYISNGGCHNAIEAALEALKRTSKESPEDRLKCLLILGEAYFKDLKYDSAIAIYKKTLDDFPENLVTTKIKYHHQLGIVYLKKELNDEARKIFDAALKLSIKEKDPVNEIVTLNYLARTTFQEGRIADAIIEYENNLKRTETLKNKYDKLHVANNDLGHALYQNGDYDRAAERLNIDIQIFQEIGDKHKEARSRYTLAETFRRKRNFDQAIEQFDHVTKIAKDIKEIGRLVRAYNGLGNVYNDTSDYKNAVNYYERSLALCNRLGDDSMAASISINLGVACNKIGQLNRAADYFKTSILCLENARSGSPSDRFFLCRAHLEMGEVYRIKRDYNKSKFYLSSAYDIASKTDGLKHYIFWINLTLAEVLIDEGHSEKADKVLMKSEQYIDDENKRSHYDRLGKIIRDGTKNEPDEDRSSAKPPAIIKQEASLQSSLPALQVYKYILEVNKFVGGEADVDFVLKSVLNHALEITNAESGLILLRNQKNELDVAVSVNVTLSDNFNEIVSIVSKKVIDSDEIIKVSEASKSDLFNNAEALSNLKVQSLLCFPIRAKQKVVGLIFLENRLKKDAFKAVDLGILRTFADQVGIAINTSQRLLKYIKNEELLNEQIRILKEKADTQSDKPNKMSGACED
ncbi:tetratricopeptide repeat protein, partial [bacterium]|nr:tetratricopeptide repeat protein [bacterium]